MKEFQVSSVEVDGCGVFTLEVREDPQVRKGFLRVDLVGISANAVTITPSDQTLFLSSLGRDLTAPGKHKETTRTPPDSPIVGYRRVYSTGLNIEGSANGLRVRRHYFDSAPEATIRIHVPAKSYDIVWGYGRQGEPIY